MIKVVPFDLEHIPLKVRWINDPKINKFLHYDLPLTVEGTQKWFGSKSKNRKDCTILYENEPIGIIGIIGKDNNLYEFYITIGVEKYHGKGIALKASKIFLNNVFQETSLEKIFLTTEPKNKKAQSLFEKVGFKHKGVLKSQLYYEIDRLSFYTKKNISGSLLYETPIIGPYLYKGNNIYIKRDDLYPYSIGGNKAKKISIIEQNYNLNNYDAIVTYGSKKSNHVRSTLQLALKYNLEMHVVTVDSKNVRSSNSIINDLFGAIYYSVPVSKVSLTIDKLLENLEVNKKKALFIPGGGHVSAGTHAYALTMKEIQNYESKQNKKFDFIFHASGTGGTQAGLIAGDLVRFENANRIIGISVGRDQRRGREHIKKALDDYLNIPISDVSISFRDDLVPYEYSQFITNYLEVMKIGIQDFDLELDPTYTSKSFAGMLNYINEQKLSGKTLLYIHTGGKPIFYDFTNKL